ncbi:MAG: 4Fe-4S binding protein [Bacillota bacterium]|nr:4Fe-4S binding protein [Bacillota bacterium]
MKTGKMLPLALKGLFTKPATISYPYQKVVVPSDFRGKLVFDPSKCVGCMLCVRDCPSGAIEIIKVGEKKYKAVVHLDKCIYCGQCCDSCVRQALRTSPEFELAVYDRKDLTVDI